MKKIQEIGLDFEVDPRPLTKEEQLAISEFIKEDKARRAVLEKRPTKTRTLRRAKRRHNSMSAYQPQYRERYKWRKIHSLMVVRIEFVMFRCTTNPTSERH